MSAAPDGGEIASDAGSLLLREVERGVKLIEGPAGRFEDGRAVGRVEDELSGLVKQRVYALALGYEERSACGVG